MAPADYFRRKHVELALRGSVRLPAWAYEYDEPDPCHDSVMLLESLTEAVEAERARAGDTAWLVQRWEEWKMDVQHGMSLTRRQREALEVNLEMALRKGL